MPTTTPTAHPISPLAICPKSLNAAELADERPGQTPIPLFIIGCFVFRAVVIYARCFVGYPYACVFHTRLFAIRVCSLRVRLPYAAIILFRYPPVGKLPRDTKITEVVGNKVGKWVIRNAVSQIPTSARRRR